MERVSMETMTVGSLAIAVILYLAVAALILGAVTKRVGPRGRTENFVLLAISLLWPITLPLFVVALVLRFMYAFGYDVTPRYKGPRA